MKLLVALRNFAIAPKKEGDYFHGHANRLWKRTDSKRSAILCNIP